MRLRRGQSLLEVVIAVAVSLILISGLISAITMAIRNSQFSQNQSLATKFSQEGMEKIRAYRDQHAWTGASPSFTADCNNLSAMGVSVLPLPYTRTVICTDTNPVDANKKIITVAVSWTDASGMHKSELSSYFSNQSLWR